MSRRNNLALALALTSGIGLYLLGPEEASVPEDMLAKAQEPLVKATAVTPPDAEKKSPEAEQSVIDEPTDEKSAEANKVAFEPPFPDRTNPFQAPKRQGRASLKAKGQNESAIELLGFVNVNGPRVALSIDGLVETASEGEKLQGIEVISIKPPAVLLQRGRQRWQATLEN